MPFEWQAVLRSVEDLPNSLLEIINIPSYCSACFQLEEAYIH